MKLRYLELLFPCLLAFIFGIFTGYVIYANKETQHVKTKKCAKAYVKCYCPPCHTLGASMLPKCKPICIKEK
jgi:hypothetical protein